MKDFKSKLKTKISADKVIEKISNVELWWKVTVDGPTKKTGDKFVVKMSDDSSVDFMVEELIPGEKLVWFISDCYLPWFKDKKEWANTRIIFDIIKKNGLTMIDFTHEGLTPELECYEACEKGWTHWITRSLSSYLSTGVGNFEQR